MPQNPTRTCRYQLFLCPRKRERCRSLSGLESARRHTTSLSRKCLQSTGAGGRVVAIPILYFGGKGVASEGWLFTAPKRV